MKREQGGWFNLFWDKDSTEKEQGFFTESPIKIDGSNFIMGKNKNIFRLANNSQYYHWEMGLKNASQVAKK